MLPAETFLEIIEFVPYVSLHRNIRYVNFVFSEFVQSIVDRMYPRRILSMWIRWDPKEKCHIITSFSSSALEDSLNVNDHGNPHERFTLPQTPPPPNILGFGRISIFGPITRELMIFFAAIKNNINNCKLDLEDSNKFMQYLNKEQISLESFFYSLPQRCRRISLDGRLSTIPTSILLSNYVLRCSNLYFMRPCNGFDNDALAKWLLNNETLTETKYVEMTLDTCLSDSKNHHNFMELFTKLSEQAKKEAFFPANFEVQLIGKPQLALQQFTVPGKLHVIVINFQVISIRGGKALNIKRKYPPIYNPELDKEIYEEEEATIIDLDIMGDIEEDYYP